MDMVAFFSGDVTILRAAATGPATTFFRIAKYCFAA
jgi:hypothetical protein